MNPKSFLGMMSDISDEYIASAAKPHSKTIRWYQVFAIAACIVLLIAAAIYPKLRIQTPEIAVPPESVAEVITTTTVSESAEHSEIQTATSPLQTTFDSVTATVSTTASVAGSAVVTETGTKTVTELPETDAHTKTESTKVEQPVNTEQPHTTDPAITEFTQPATTSSVTDNPELTAGPIPATVSTAQLTTDTLQTVSLPTQTSATETEPVDPLGIARTLFETFISENHLPARIADEAQYPEFTEKTIIEWDPASDIDVEHLILQFAKENHIDGYLFILHQVAPGAIIGDSDTMLVHK